MTITMTWGGPAGVAAVATGAAEPAGAGLAGGRLGTTTDGVALDAVLDGDEAGAGLPHPASASRAAATATRCTSIPSFS
jgi:hypothetical protein